jgi:hypothetical protein
MRTSSSKASLSTIAKFFPCVGSRYRRSDFLLRPVCLVLIRCFPAPPWGPTRPTREKEAGEKGQRDPAPSLCDALRLCFLGSVPVRSASVSFALLSPPSPPSPLCRCALRLRIRLSSRLLPLCRHHSSSHSRLFLGTCNPSRISSPAPPAPVGPCPALAGSALVRAPFPFTSCPSPFPLLRWPSVSPPPGWVVTVQPPLRRRIRRCVGRFLASSSQCLCSPAYRIPVIGLNFTFLWAALFAVVAFVVCCLRPSAFLHCLPLPSEVCCGFYVFVDLYISV